MESDNELAEETIRHRGEDITPTIAPTKRSRRRLGGTILIYVSSFLLVVSSLVKFSGVPAVVSQMGAMGFAEGKVPVIAMLEILCAGLFLWLRTRTIGLLLVSAYLGGAVCAHFRASEYAQCLSPAFVLALSWLGMWLRYPVLLWSGYADASATQRPDTSREPISAGRHT
jgi:hypothetical protein